MRLGTAFFLAFLALAEVLDLPYWFLEGLTSRHLASQAAPRLFLFDHRVVLWILLAQAVLIWQGGRALLPVMGGERRTLGTAALIVAAALVLVRVGYGLYLGYVTPWERWRLLQSASRVGNIAQRVELMGMKEGHFPVLLGQVGLEPLELYDGWGWRFHYELRNDGREFTIEALGVPERLRASPHYSECRATRELARH